MFTGLIQATGTLLAIVPPAHASAPTRLTVQSPELAPKLQTGDSIAVSGVCLTALNITPTGFSADLAEETVRRTTLSRLTPGALVNLELPTPAGSPLGGHVVQGHVDGVGKLLALEPLDATDQANTDWRMRIKLPQDMARYVVAQGSLTIEGISLTVADIADDVVSIAIIPHTYASTALHALLAGAPVNLEVDVLAKYAEKQKAHAAHTLPGWTLTEDYLLANGY